MINILYEDNHILVVEKPINIPVQEDDSKDIDFLNILKDYLKKEYNKPGNVYLGLIHRLDRPVGGLMVFAKTSKAAARLSAQLKENNIKKTYYAVLCGNISIKKDTLIDCLLKDEKTNMVKVDSSGKKSILDYELISIKDNMSLVRINLQTGRSHQIRVQFSSRNYPLFGDQRYNKHAKSGEQIALFAGNLSFEHPVTKEVMNYSLELPKRYPFNLFI